MQGLAFQPLSKLGVPPPFFSMQREGLLDWSGFSLWLNPNILSQGAPAGELIFGGSDPDRYSGQIQYHPNQSARCSPASCSKRVALQCLVCAAAVCPDRLARNHWDRDSGL